MESSDPKDGEDREQLASLWEEMRDLAKTYTSHYRVQIFADIAAALAKAGDAEASREVMRDALQAMDALRENRESTLGTIAVAQTSAGDTGESLTTAAKIETPYWRADALRLIANARCDAGDKNEARRILADALNVIPTIPEARDRARQLLWIAQLQSRVGDEDLARATVLLMEPLVRRAAGNDERDSVLRTIAYAKATLKDLEGTRRILARIRSSSDDFLRNEAGTLASAGDIEGAAKAAAEIKSADTRAFAFASIGVAQAEAGDLPGAAASAKEAVARAHCVAEVLAAIARKKMRAGDLSGALATAREIESGLSLKATLLAELAAAQAKAGDATGARQTMRDAGEAAVADHNEGVWRVMTLAAVAAAWTRLLGDVSRTASYRAPN